MTTTNIGYKKIFSIPNGKESKIPLICVLEILGQNNENRKGVADPDFAKFRCSKAKVLQIFSMPKDAPDLEKTTLSNIPRYYVKGESWYPEKKIVYQINQIITVDNYDENVEETCSRGIHYFKTMEAAFWFSYSNCEGLYRSYHDNGQKMIEGKINEEGTFIGKTDSWYENGQMKFEGEYASDGSGYNVGKWNLWYKTGQKSEEGEYASDGSGNKIGLWLRWGIYRGKIEKCEYDGSGNVLFRWSIYI